MVSNPIDIGSVKNASLTVLIDNKADLIVKSSDQIKYFTDKPLLAEHGFSVLIQLNDSERILWDAGVSEEALLENIRRMKLDVASIEKIALSHGHRDHYAAMSIVLSEMDLLPKHKEWNPPVDAGDIDAWMQRSRIPIVAHPAAFRERWWLEDSGKMAGPRLAPPRKEWQALGANIILSESPYKLNPGCWTTGYIPRNSFEKTGRSSKMRYRKGSSFIADDLEDDQAIVINIEEKGLVILSGCAHSGIVNTIMYAKEFTEIDTIYAIIGGFHLARATDDEINQTVDYIQSVDPHLVVPTHCTGSKAIRRFALEMPDKFVEGVVGAKHLL